MLSLFQRPLSEVEKAKRRVDTYERFKPSFDWGLYAVYRSQEFDLDTVGHYARPDIFELAINTRPASSVRAAEPTNLGLAENADRV